MKYSAKQYAQALLESIADQKDKRVKVICDAWLALIAERGQVSLLPEIQLELDAYTRRDELTASVTTAKPLTKDLQKWVSDYLSDYAQGKKIVINEIIDKELLSGLVIRYDDKKIDFSLKNILNNLKEKIVN